MKKYYWLLLLMLTYIPVSFAKKPALQTGNGTLDITTTPPGAIITINGFHTDFTTPATLFNIKPGTYTIEVSLSDYLFSKRQIMVTPDTTIFLSFELISLSDTAHIIGDLRLGILYLPQTPIDNPYLVDNRQVYAREITLNVGKHSVAWEGGNIYSSLDTVIEIFPGKLTTFQFSPQRLYEKLQVSTNPADAEIYINNRFYANGELSLTLATGTYSVSVKRLGYYVNQQQVQIQPDDPTLLTITLLRIPDRDGDGFLDSIDQCPETYGLYDGCPKQKKSQVLRRSISVLADNFRVQPLVCSIQLLNFLNRVPTNKRFREFISYFNDGQFYSNNKNGFTMANSSSCSFYGLFLGIELGQWYSGLEYRKLLFNPLLIPIEKDTYCVYFDSTSGINPTVQFPSTALSFGINFMIKRMNVSFGFGYQWEDIIIKDLVTKKNLEKYLKQTGNIDLAATKNKYIGPRTSISFNNDFWYTLLVFQLDVYRLKRSTIGVYASSFLSITQQQTGWRGFHAGITYKIVAFDKSRKTGKSKK
jgi:hypothetical protein